MKGCHTIFLIVLSVLCFAHAIAQTTQPIPTLQEVGATRCPADIAPVESPFSTTVTVERPTFPARTLSIINTQGDIQRAIDRLAKKGGGHVVVPSGEWHTGRLQLKDNIDLHLEAGATIVFSSSINDYLPAIATRNEGVELQSLGALIYSDHASHIALTGAGYDADGRPLSRLVGPGRDNEIYRRRMDGLTVENFLDLQSDPSLRLFDGSDITASPRGLSPTLLAHDSLLQANRHCIFLPMFFAPMYSEDILVEGVTFENSVFWNIVPLYSRRIILRGCTVKSEGGRTDGIDIESSENVLIEYCTLACGDDCFTLKAGRAEDGLRVGKPTEHVVIRYCLAEEGPGGLTIGSETAGFIRHVYVHHCVFVAPSNGLYFKSRRGRGGGAEDLCFSHIRMINPRRAIHFDMLGSPFYMGDLALRLPVREVTLLTPVFRRLEMKEILVEQCREFLLAKGLPESPIEDLSISHVEVHPTERDMKVQDVCNFLLFHCQMK